MFSGGYLITFKWPIISDLNINKTCQEDFQGTIEKGVQKLPAT
jgi:hypothetical protein